jgi:hypothetical protein
MTSPQSVTANFSAVPVVSLNPTSISFGTVDLFSAHSKTVTVTNIGGATLDISNISIMVTSGPHADIAFLSSCHSTLAPGKSCAIDIAYVATKVGPFAATVNLSDNAPGGTQEVPITATVINPRSD